MYSAPAGRRGRSVGGGFEAVPQTDADNINESDPDSRWTRIQFQDRVQHALRQGSLEQIPEIDSIFSSPALSDHTLVSGDYLEVHSNDYQEVDIGEYVEYCDYYGPQAADATSSPTKSVKAGLGIEVRPIPAPEDLVDDGGYVYDEPSDLAYRGCEGNIERQDPDEPPNHKPVVLRKRFLVILVVVLILLLGVTELAVHVFSNDASSAPGPVSHSNSTDLRPRSVELTESELDSLYQGELRDDDLDEPTPTLELRGIKVLRTPSESAPGVGDSPPAVENPGSTGPPPADANPEDSRPPRGSTGNSQPVVESPPAHDKGSIIQALQAIDRWNRRRVHLPLPLRIRASQTLPTQGRLHQVRR
jgi:hypothetical protein